MLTFQNCGSSVLGSCGHILTKSVSDLCLRVHVSMCPKSPRPLSTQRSLGHPAPSTQPRGQEGQEVCWALKAGVGGGGCFLVDGAWQVLLFPQIPEFDTWDSWKCSLPRTPSLAVSGALP